MNKLFFKLIIVIGVLLSATVSADTIRLRPGVPTTLKITTAGAWTASDVKIVSAQSGANPREISERILFTLDDSVWVFIQPSLRAKPGRYKLRLNLLFGVYTHVDDLYIPFIPNAEISHDDLARVDEPYEVTLKGVPEGIVTIRQYDGSPCEVSINGVSEWKELTIASRQILRLIDNNGVPEDATFWIRYNSGSAQRTNTPGTCHFTLREFDGTTRLWDAVFDLPSPAINYIERIRR